MHKRNFSAIETAFATIWFVACVIDISTTKKLSTYTEYAKQNGAVNAKEIANNEVNKSNDVSTKGIRDEGIKLS